MIEIYTDGATSNNGLTDAHGGWAYIVLNNSQNIIFKNSGYIANATNNICELTAILMACQATDIFDDEIIIYSDSAYCINCYKKQWYLNWEKNGWLTTNRKPVANRELWEKLIPYFKNNKITFQKVAGHSNNIYNNMVDKMAVQAKYGRTND